MIERSEAPAIAALVACPARRECPAYLNPRSRSKNITFGTPLVTSEVLCFLHGQPPILQELFGMAKKGPAETGPRRHSRVSIHVGYIALTAIAKIFRFVIRRSSFR
jgi:hypothetical protein